MNIAYLDTIGGIAGDMTLSAFVSAGLSIDELTAELAKLPLEGFELVGSHVQHSGVDAIHIEVAVPHQPHGHRLLRDINSLIDRSTLPSSVKDRAVSVFAVIAEAEAKIHNTPIEKVHFHEVGAVDSIVDIVGTAICLEKFNIDRVYSSPVKLGNGGLIQVEHGRMPVPTPATLEILKNYPTILTTVPHELTTPTGAAIIKALSSGMLNEEVLRISTIGYGSGTQHFTELPNLLRVVIGTLADILDEDQVSLVETNIDDMNPQVYPFLVEKLLQLGAHDAYLTPIIMKKGRPGVLLSVMVNRSKLDAVVDLVYDQTSTIGLRIQNIGRRKLPRQHIEIQTSFGLVKAKAVQRHDEEVITPEFEECRRIAEEQHVPLLDVMRRLEQELARVPKEKTL